MSVTKILIFYDNNEVVCARFHYLCVVLATFRNRVLPRLKRSIHAIKQYTCKFRQNDDALYIELAIYLTCMPCRNLVIH